VEKGGKYVSRARVVLCLAYFVLDVIVVLVDFLLQVANFRKKELKYMY